MAKPRPFKAESDQDQATSGGNYREISARRCWIDGVPLDRGGMQEGWCPEARAYAVAYIVRVIWEDERGRERKLDLARRTDCPFACPLCRAPLTWDGGCDGCQGSHTPSDRRTWTFPGDRHEDAELGGDGRCVATGHYQFVTRGPRRVATEAETLVGFAAIKQALATVDARAPRLSPVDLALSADPEEPAWVREDGP